MYHELGPKVIICAVCEREFDTRKRNHGKGVQRYCGPKCRQTADNRRHWRRNNPLKSKEELTRVCVVCRVTFVTDAHHPKALACSVKCNEARMNAKRRRMTYIKPPRATKECDECGTTYIPDNRVGSRAKFCSPTCSTRSQTRASNKRRRSQLSGPHPNQNRLSRKDWLDARRNACERDQNQCCFCGSDDRKLHVHHLFHRTEAEKNDHALDGLVTLCNSCHRKMHEFRFGRDGDDYVISGPVFDWLGITEVRIAKNA